VKPRIQKRQEPHLLKKQRPNDAASKIASPINLSATRPVAEQTLPSLWLHLMLLEPLPRPFLLAG
jgi:hypothetical protein